MQTVSLLPCLLAAVLTVHAVRAQDDCPPDLMSPSCDYYGRWSRGGPLVTADPRPSRSHARGGMHMVTAHPRPSKRSRRQLVHMLMEIAAKQQGEAVKRFAEEAYEDSRSLRAERLSLKNILMGRTY